MIGIVLAAGYGTRLGELGTIVPIYHFIPLAVNSSWAFL